MNANFIREKEERISKYRQNRLLRKAAGNFLEKSIKNKYSYNFSWLGRPVIQYPQDLILMQEIIWEVKPDLIIETGIAHGGSLIFYASMLELIGSGDVVGIDLDIREHNRKEIQRHPLFDKIKLIEGSSTDETVINKVQMLAKNRRNIMVILDSDHTHGHVLRELQIYSPFVSKGSYLVVFDTIIEHLPDSFYQNRSWGKGNNPKTAVLEFLKTNDRFTIDKNIEAKALITMAPDGYLKCVKD
ncbi:MAG: cephalosporin hydroxylase family protein [Bacillota bacterium]|nr:cephalosporin hydroxylase family protein [Bacillota bacterium]MDW7684820.1 cephalosporin hydroxylase family protein [Bacillota bacterium]